MRWLFLILLVLNLAYIAWQVTMPATELYANVSPLKNVQTIVLLSENAEIDAAHALRKSARQDKAAASVIAGREEIGGAAIEDQVAVEPLESVENKPVVIAEVDLIDIEKSVQAKPTPEILAQKWSASVESAEEARQETSVQTESCFTLGPFRNLNELRSLTRDIKAYVTNTDFRGKEEKEQALYWVYVKPEKSRKKAVAVGKRLKAKKVKDFFVIREGEKINGISLGYFRNKAGAYGLVSKVKKLGFKVAIEPVYKTYTVYWLDYQLAAGTDVPESIFAKRLKSSRKDKVNRLSRDCDI